MSNSIGVPKEGDAVTTVLKEINDLIVLPSTLIGAPTFKAIVYSTPLDSILDAL